jgi:hypothetical protein
VTTRRYWTIIGALTVVGLVLRVIWVVWAAREPASLYDPARYLGFARQIADGHGMTQVDLKSLAAGKTPHDYATAYYPPGYPWFLGIVAWISKPFTKDIPLFAGIVQAVLGAATVALGSVVARRVAGAWAGIAAAVGLALYPNLIFHTGALLSETLYDFLFMAFLAVLVAKPWDEGLSTRRVAAASVLLGLAIMVRPISLAVIPVVAGVWWWQRRTARRTAESTDEADESAGDPAPSPFPMLRPSLVMIGCVLACIVPWTVRNEVRMHAFVPISTNTGDNLCMGHGARATGAFRVITPDDPCTPEHDPRSGSADEVAADHEKTSAGIKGIEGNLGREPWLLWRRFYYMWVRDGDHDAVVAVQAYRVDRWISIPTEARLFRIADIAYWIVCAAGLAGMVVLLVRRRPLDLLLAGSAVMTALVPLAFFGDSRFKVPVIPLLIVAAACLLPDRPLVDVATVDPELL